MHPGGHRFEPGILHQTRGRRWALRARKPHAQPELLGSKYWKLEVFHRIAWRGAGRKETRKRRASRGAEAPASDL